MHIMLRTSVVILSLLAANLSVWAQQEEPDLWIYEYKEVVDSVRADSLYKAYKITLKERMTKAWAEPAVNIITAIDALMEYEKSGNKIEPSNNLFRQLLRLARSNQAVTEKELKTIAKGKVPKGFTEKVLIPAKTKLQGKIDAYNPNMPSWDNVFTHHNNRFEIEYTSSEYEEFDIGNSDGARTRFVNMEMVTLPKKKITIPKPNPECRDNYFNGTFVRQKVNSWGMENHFTPFMEYEHWKKQDAAQESIGWEWLYTDDIQNETKYVKTYFPEELGYHQHPAHPEYRLKYVIDWGGYNAFDEKGTLVRVDNMTKFFQFTKYQDEVLDYILMQLCKHDFLANKYGINSAKPETLLALRIKFDLSDAVDARFKKYMKMAQDARDEKLSATTPAQYAAAKKKQNEALNVLMEYVAKEREPQAMNYIKQLKSDHAAELSYLYKIERVDNVTFKLFFLNDKMECGCIALMKWSNKEPYEAQYKIELLPLEKITIRK